MEWNREKKECTWIAVSLKSTTECNNDERNLCILKVAHIGSAFTLFATIEKNVGRVHTKRSYETQIHQYTPANVDKRNIKYKTNAHIAYIHFCVHSHSFARSLVHAQTFVNSHISYKCTLALDCTEYNKSYGRRRRQTNRKRAKDDIIHSRVDCIEYTVFFHACFSLPLFTLHHAKARRENSQNAYKQKLCKNEAHKTFICQSEGNPIATATTVAYHFSLWDFQEKLNCEKTLRPQRMCVRTLMSFKYVRWPDNVEVNRNDQWSICCVKCNYIIYWLMLSFAHTHHSVSYMFSVWYEMCPAHTDQYTAMC